MPDPASALGEPIGAGRAADVYDLGDGRVLRRYRDGRSAEIEDEVMRWLHAVGYPVPRVFTADGTDLVMERLEGRTMLDALGAAPWRARALGRELADLHRRLAAVPLGDAPPALQLRFAGTEHATPVVAHLDLHPDNVMLTPTGPVVFDWANVCLAPPGTDVVMTWLLMTTSDVDVSPWLRPIVGRVKSALVRAFVDRSGGPADRDLVQRVVRHRIDDPNVTPTEIVRLRAVLAG